MADFDKPTLDSLYTDFAVEIRDNDAANAVMFSASIPANLPINAVQFAGGEFGLWNGVSFDVQPITITGGGTGATSAAAARANLDLSSVPEANALYMKILSNGSDINDDSIFRTNLGVYGTTEVYTQTEVDTLVAFASQAQAEAGVDTTTYMNPLRTEQAIQAIGRIPVSIWTGSDTLVSDAEILASTGFIVVAGIYFITVSGSVFEISVSDISLDAHGSSNSDSDGSDNITVITSKRQSGLISVISRPQGTPPSLQTITEIKFIPL